MNSLKINHIKPLVEVNEYSLYIFILLLVSLLVIIGFVLFYIYKKIQNKKINMQKVYVQKIKNIDITDSKNAAYSITKYLQLLEKKENQISLLDELKAELIQYKYKKDIKEFSEKTIYTFNKFKDVL